MAPGEQEGEEEGVESHPGTKLRHVIQYRVEQDDDGMRLDRWLKAKFPKLPNSLFQKMIRKNKVPCLGPLCLLLRILLFATN